MRATTERPRGFTVFLFGKYTAYVRRLTPLFAFCAFLFVFSLILGFVMGEGIPGSALEDLLGGLPDPSELNFFELFGFIVANNVLKSFIFMLLGVLLSVPPLFFVVLNGFFIGWFSYSTSLDYGLAFVAAALIPHGVIEIPTLLLSMAMGMGLGYQAINRLRGRSGLREEFGTALRVFAWRIVPLLFLAAVFEVTLTPLIVALLFL